MENSRRQMSISVDFVVNVDSFNVAYLSQRAGLLSRIWYLQADEHTAQVT